MASDESGRRVGRWGQLRSWVDDLRRGFDENDLLTYASAFAFQTLFAIVPVALAALALAGLIGLGEIYTRDLQPELQRALGDAAFEVVDDAVQQVLRADQVFWLTFGVALAVWEVSSVVRALMGVLSSVYEDREERSFWRRIAISIGLSIPVGFCVVGAIAIALAGGEALEALGLQGAAYDIAGFVVRWAVALSLLFVAFGLLVRYGPVHERPVGWISLGAALAVALWIAFSALFYLYIVVLADYSSIFAGLAVVIVLLTYLYFSGVALLVGVQVDALVRKRAEGQPGQPRVEGESEADVERRAALLATQEE